MTNSKADSPMPVQTSWLETPKAPGRLIFSMTIPGRLPSWNDILGMEQWARYDFKNELADSFLSELRRSAATSLTTTTAARNIMLTYCATLESYRATRAKLRALRQSNKRLEKASAKKSGLRSLNSDRSAFDGRKLPF